MASVLLDLAVIERQIALVRANLGELIEQAAAYSGAADENLASQRIAELETKLKALETQRDRVSRSGRRKTNAAAKRSRA